MVFTENSILPKITENNVISMVEKAKAILPKNIVSTAKESSLRFPDIYCCRTGGRRESIAMQIFQGVLGHENSQKVNLAKNDIEHR